MKNFCVSSMQIPLSGEAELPELEDGEGDTYTVPANIRPVLSTYRLEVQIPQFQ